MRTVLNILNFVLGGFATTLSWLLATLVSVVLIFTLPLTRSCWEITKLSLVPFGNEAVHVDELEPGSKNALMNTGGTLLNILWLIFFGWRNAAQYSVADLFRLVAVFDAYCGRDRAVHYDYRHPCRDRQFQNCRHCAVACRTPGRPGGGCPCCA